MKKPYLFMKSHEKLLKNLYLGPSFIRDNIVNSLHQSNPMILCNYYNFLVKVYICKRQKKAC